MRRGLPAPVRARLAAAAILAAVAVAAVAPRTSLAQSPRPHAQMGPYLERLVRESEARGESAALEMAERRGIRVRPGGHVPVILEAAGGQRARHIDRALLRRLGARVDAVSRSWMRVLIPLHLVRRLEDHPGLARFRAPLPAHESGFGILVAESVAHTGAADLHALGAVGAGVKVAVVDLGFSGLSGAIAAGELPAGTVGVDFTGTGLESGTYHGVGVAEHVVDMAPGVELHCLKVGDAVDLENAADYVRDNGIAIANHSVSWKIGSYYDDTGPINDVINRSHDIDGVFWSVAAGNAAERHWRGGWIDADADGWLEFAPADERMRLVTSSVDLCLYLNWDQYGASVTDLDLFLYDKDLSLVASSEDAQVGPQAPVEQLCVRYQGWRAPYGVSVQHFAGPTEGLDITLVSLHNGLEHATPSSSLLDPAVAHGAFTVGAVNQADWALPDPPLQPFSGQGPTNDGRLKPDLVAPDATTSWTYGVLASSGTSFSAPAAAGAAALILSESPGSTAADLANALAAWALDAGAPGPDHAFGAGRLDLPLDAVVADDADGDGVPDAEDNCPFSPNPDQLDLGGVGGSAPDGIGDACQCAEVTGDGSVLDDDVDAIRTSLADLAPLSAPERCNAIGAAGDGDCEILDAVAIERALAGYAPGVQQVCAPAQPAPDEY